MLKNKETKNEVLLTYDILPDKIDLQSHKQQTLLVKNFVSSEINIPSYAKVQIIAFLTENLDHLAKIRLHFEGEGSELLFLIFVVGTGENKFLFETESIHSVPHTKAQYHVKCAMFDQSFVDYKGNLIIQKSAPDTDVSLAHHTLLLSPQAHTKTLPALEIEADEVKAGHAATLGKVDEDLLFYLMTRGIEPKKAEKMLIDGFFEDQLALISDENLRDQLRQDILKKIPDHE